MALKEAKMQPAAAGAPTAAEPANKAASITSWSVIGDRDAPLESPTASISSGSDTMPDVITGDLLARATQMATDGKPASTGAAIKNLLQRERKHEIVALVGRELTVNWANYNAYKTRIDPAAPVMVVSFLGDTSVGKSTTIAALMSDEEERPHVQRGRDQTASTTFNVNLYASASLADGLAVNFLDFEGESGSETPLMAGGKARDYSKGGGKGAGSGIGAHARSLTDQTAHLLGLDGLSNHSSPLARAEAVREFFPKLAYCISDVVVLIGTEPFYSTRYLERAVSFAKRANAGVADVDLPVLVLLSNKRAPDECELDIQKATEKFTSNMGSDMATLEAYFSAVICADIPHARGVVTDEEGVVHNGAEAYRVQMDKLRLLLASLVRQRIAARDSSMMLAAGSGGGGAGAQRLITSRHGLWFTMLPKVLRHINAGDAVHVSHLVDAAWLTSVAEVQGNRDEAMNAYKAVVTYARPPRSLSARAPVLHEDVYARFGAYHALVVDIAVRMTSARLRALDPSLLLPGKVEDFSRSHLDGALRLLEEVTPCRAMYGEDVTSGQQQRLGTPVDRPGEPVACLTECRSHARSHRGSRPVRGGGSSLWQRLVNLLPYNPVWPGHFSPMLLDLPDRQALVDDVSVQVGMTLDEWNAQLAALQATHSAGGLLSVQFAPLGFSAAAANSSSSSSSSDNVVIGRPSGVRLRAGPAIDPTVMPYCVGCSRKVAASAAGSAKKGAAAASSSSSAASSAAADGGNYYSEGSGAGSSDAGFGGWISSVFHAFSGGSGSSASQRAASASSSAAAHSRPTSASSSSSNSTRSDQHMVQEVVFGLCRGCYAAACGS